MQSGQIFNVQRYSFNDGQGIRTVVFFKGCPLNCLWCSNPEGKSPKTALMFNESICIGCKRCADACPIHATTAEAGQIVWDRQKCTECMACVPVCVAKARTACGRAYSVDELISAVERDFVFYNRSGGGVTVSGGEPLMQAAFVAEFLSRLKNEYGMNTAIETCNEASWQQAKSVYDSVDIFNFDIKHMNGPEHKRLTGADNAQILENIRRTAEEYDFSKKTMVIRIPVIPGLNSSDENIMETVNFAEKLKVVRRIDLLPYHRYGAVKYDRIKGDSYKLADLGDEAPEALMTHLKKLVESRGFLALIGG